MAGPDLFESRIPMDALRILLEIGRELHFDPTSSIEMEQFCLDILGTAPGPPVNLKEWLAESMRHAFRCVDEPPRWVQNPNWPVGRDGPYWFIGQIDCRPTAGLFEESTTLFVFIDAISRQRMTVLQAG